jgi:hypothetical protein
MQTRKDREEEGKDLIDPDDLVSPASQLGRLRQTGGTPESRRQIDPDARLDSEEWIEPKEDEA